MNEQTPLFQEPQPGSRPETSTTTGAPADSGELLAAVKGLQYQFNTLLILMLIVSGTLAVFFYMQSRQSGREVRNLRANVLPQIHHYNTNTVPQMQRFLGELTRYGQQRPEIVPLLKRYGIEPQPAPAAAPPPAR